MARTGSSSSRRRRALKLLFFRFYFFSKTEVEFSCCDRGKRTKQNQAKTILTGNVVQPLHLRDRLQDRVPHLDHVDVRHEVEDRGGEPLQQSGRTALASCSGEEGLGARRVGGWRGRERRRRRLVKARLIADKQQRGARVLPGGPGGKPPRGGGGEGSCCVCS